MEKLCGQPHRTKVLLFVLLLSVGLGAFSQARIWALEAELIDDASALAAENFEAGNEVATRTTVSVPYLVFGTPAAKIEVYIRDVGVVAKEVIFAIEYNYVRGKAGWRLIERAHCHDELCQMRGAQTFSAKAAALAAE